MQQLTAEQQALKDEFTRKRGYWHTFWDGVLVMDPEFLNAFLELASVPWTNGTLEPKVREFMYIAIDASTTHMYEPGLRIHIRNALRHGATGREIFEVYQLTSSIGMHSLTLGMPALAEECRKAGRGAEVQVKLNEQQLAMKAEFTEKVGYWDPMLDDMLALSPDIFKAFTRFSSVPWRNGSLSPKVKELICIAVDAACTQLYEPSLRVHIANALKHGATVQEVVEVLQLVSVLGIHTVTMGMPILVEELEAAGLPI